jgi:uncharacterized membrane protein
VNERTDKGGRATQRVLVSGVVGLGAGAAAALAGGAWFVVALCATDVAELTYVFQVWRDVWPTLHGNVSTADLARREDTSPLAAEIVLIIAGAASLIAVVFALVKAGHSHAPARGLLTGLTVASVALAWLAVHMVNMLRYARLYYGHPEGGIDFSDGPPDYLDFAYLALTIGMTYQVSDTTLQSHHIRRVALRHALLSYLYGTFIVAITVSSVASLLGR